MKNIVYLCISLLTISSWSCHPTWWEVQPQAIYSPADFSAYNVTADEKYITIEFSTNLKNRSGDVLGVYLYDNLSLLQLQLNKEKQFVSDSSSNQINRWSEAKIDNNKAKVVIERPASVETTYYLLPVLRNHQANDTVRNYFSTNYLKIQLSPWLRLANLNIISSKSVRFFTDSTSLFYTLKNYNYLYFYKLDTTTNLFNQTGATPSIDLNKFTNSAASVNSLHYGFYNQRSHQYNLIISSGNSQQSQLGRLVLDGDFNVVDYKVIAQSSPNQTVEVKKAYYQSGVLHLLYATYPYSSVDKKGTLIRQAISADTGDVLFTYRIGGDTQQRTIAFMGSDLLVLSTEKTSTIPNFIYYKYIGNNLYSVKIFSFSEIKESGYYTIAEDGNSAYLYVSSHLYKVISDKDSASFINMGLNEIRQSSISSSQNYDQALFYRGNLTILYSDGQSSTNSPPQLWLLNPLRTSIDRQHPYVEIVPTNR